MKDNPAAEYGMPNLVDIRVAARILHISVQTLYQHRNDVPRIRIGRRVLFDTADLEAYINSHREYPQSTTEETPQ